MVVVATLGTSVQHSGLQQHNAAQLQTIHPSKQQGTHRSAIPPPSFAQAFTLLRCSLSSCM